MKIKKLIAALLVAVMAVCTVFALTACGEEEEKPDPTPAPTTKSYQLTGSFTDSLGPLGEGFEFMLNLNADGSSVLSRYNPYSYNASDAATNTSFEAKFMEGTWKEAEKDGVECLQIKLEVKKDDGTSTDASTSYAYEVAGEYSFECTFPIVPGMGFSRSVTLKGGETKTYADANAFIQAKKKVFVAPESVAIFADAEKDAKAYVQADGTVLLYSGYTQYATGTYYKTSDTFGIVVEGEEVEVTRDGNKASFAYTYSMGGGYDTEYTYVCEDISVLPDKAPAGGEEETGDIYTATIHENLYGNEADVTYTLTLTDAEHYTLKAAAGAMSLANMSGTYTKAENAVTLTAGDTTGSTISSLVTGKLQWTLGANGAMTLVTAAS